MDARNTHRCLAPAKAAALALACIALLASLLAAPGSQGQTAGTTALEVEIVEDDAGSFGRVTELIVDFQRRANAEIASSMTAIERGDDLGAFVLALVIAFVYGMIHAFGPGHGKFVIISYFLGREARVMRGVTMAAQIAVIHVIAAVVVVWLADLVLQVGFGIGLSEVPGVRAGSFLIIAGIGVYMLIQAVRGSFGPVGEEVAAHGHGHGHSHSHAHDDFHSHSHAHGHFHSQSHTHGHFHGHGHGHTHTHGLAHGTKVEGGLLALAAGMVPCPGAVLIMLYAVANDMIYSSILLVASMSLGIGLSICAVGIGAILARKAAIGAMERSGGRGVDILRQGMNYAGAVLVTLIGLVSFVAFLDVPLG